MYKLVAQDLKARKGNNWLYSILPNIVNLGDPVLMKNHTAGPFYPIYKGNYRAVTVQGKMVHITADKYILPGKG